MDMLSPDEFFRRVGTPDTWIACGGDGPTPEARAELRDYAEWLRLPKPRPEFHAWRAAKDDVRGGEAAESAGGVMTITIIRSVRSTPTVERSGWRYAALCSDCGWAGSDYSSEFVAEFDGRVHKDSCPAVAKRPDPRGQPDQHRGLI